MFGRNSESWLIVGLGNPGKDYTRTRHNCGFRAIDILAQQLGCKIDKGKFQGLYGQVTRDGKKLFLLKPQTYMNLSGKSVLQLSAYYNIPPQRIIVMFDDISLVPGRLRIRADGSAGGHNGLKNIIAHLGTEAFARIRLGAGRSADERRGLIDFVLHRFSAEEAAVANETAALATKAILCWIDHGLQEAQNRFNAVRTTNPQEKL